MKTTRASSSFSSCPPPSPHHELDHNNKSTHNHEETISQRQEKAESSTTEASCRSCRALVQHVLTVSTSRPRTLLQSMFRTAMPAPHYAEHGMQVAIPAAAAAASSSETAYNLPSHQEVVSGNDGETASASSRSGKSSQGTHEPGSWPDRLETPWLSSTVAASSPLIGHGEPEDHHHDRAVQPTPMKTALPTPADESVPGASSSGAVSSNFPWEYMSISCRDCASTGPEANARAFVMGPDPLSIVICQNRLQPPPPPKLVSASSSSSSSSSSPPTLSVDQIQEMEEILTHELVHVYDVRQLQLDLRQCEQLAYSEVRAAREAECAGSWTPRTCIRHKAWTATHNLFPHTSRECVSRVWEAALADRRPWEPQSSSTATTATSSSSFTPPSRSGPARPPAADPPDHLFATDPNQRRPAPSQFSMEPSQR